jgi:hypothetical protein
MKTANQLARRVRDADFTAPGPGDDPPAYLTVPVNVARETVTIYHEEGEEKAREYLDSSVVARWANHSNPSMATSNSNVLSGFDAYIEADRRDGREVIDLAIEPTLHWPAGPLLVRIDVVLADGEDLAARVLFWDGLEIDREDAELIAAPYAAVMEQQYPERTITAVGVWQARYQSYYEVPFEIAERRLERARIIHQGL